MTVLMLRRARAEDGFGMLELIAAVFVITIALLALMAGYDSAFVSLHNAQRKTTAATLADAQLELYRALPYASIGLDATTTSGIGDPANASYDALYSTNAVLDGDFVTDPATGVVSQDPSGTVNDVTIPGCGASAACSPVQTVTTPDHHSYRVETFIRDRPGATGISWTERVVWVIVRDAGLSTEPELVRESTAFDRGPGF
jgi:Tfp pilus assembly protein PilV